jgi:hypothetical protein
MEVSDMKDKMSKLMLLWEKDELNKQEILVPIQYRILRRCDSRKEGCRCVLPATYKLEAFYDGKLQAVRYFCSKHLAQWYDDLEEDMQRGVVSLCWSFEVSRIASPRTVRKLIKMALILHGL